MPARTTMPGTFEAEQGDIAAGRGRNLQALRLAGALAAFAFCYGGVIVGLVDQWSNHYLYSYGFAVPLISAYMVRHNWPKLRTLAAAPDYVLGVPVIVAGALLLLIGHIGALITVEELSLVVTVAGLVLVLFGRAATRAIWFPLVNLLLMVPIWDRLINGLQTPSQLISGKIAARMFALVGIPVFQSHTTIVLPSITLEVLRECSGVNQLIVVFAMVLPAAYLFIEGWFRRAALVVIGLVVAYLTNGLRIMLIGFLAEYGVRSTNDAVHMLQGLAISIVGYALIGVCFSIAARGNRRAAPEAGTPAPAVTIRPSARRHRRWAEAAVVLVLVVAGAHRMVFAASATRPGARLDEVPKQIAAWSVDPFYQQNRIETLPSADAELFRGYRHSSGRRIELYVGYYAFQRQGHELAGSMVRSLEAGASRRRIGVGADAFELNDQITQDGNRTTRTLFWFDINGRRIADLQLAKAWTVWDGITQRRTNGAVIIVAWDGGVDGGDELPVPVAEFVAAMVPAVEATLR